MSAPVSAADPRRRLFVLGGVGAALVLALLLGTKVMGGGGGGSDDSSSTASSTRRSNQARTGAGATATPAPATEAPATAETFEVFTTKNPFVPLRTKAAPAPAAPRPAPVAAASPTPVAVATPAPATTTAAPAATTTLTGVQATEPTRTAIRVALLDVFTDGGRTVANVRVADTVSKVAAGDAFATNFKVVSLDGASRCGEFLFGDDEFRLCKGEEVLK